jgi:hypothetical protein
MEPLLDKLARLKMRARFAQFIVRLILSAQAYIRLDFGTVGKQFEALVVTNGKLFNSSAALRIYEHTSVPIIGRLLSTFSRLWASGRDSSR